MPASAQSKKTTATPRRRAAARPASNSSEDKYAPQAWGNSGIGGLTDLEVPSGQLCLVRRPGIEQLLKEGVLTNLDALTKLVQAEHVKRVEEPHRSVEATSSDAMKLIEEPGKFDEMMTVVDKVMCAVVVKPELHRPPNDITSRDSAKIYTDQIDMEDKMFIFQFALGGTKELERFRQESERAVASLDTGEAVGGKA